MLLCYTMPEQLILYACSKEFIVATSLFWLFLQVKQLYSFGLVCFFQYNKFLEDSQISYYQYFWTSRTFRDCLKSGKILETERTCIWWLIASRSARISLRFLVPSTLRNVVAARSLVDLLASSTLVMEVVAL